MTAALTVSFKLISF